MNIQCVNCQTTVSCNKLPNPSAPVCAFCTYEKPNEKGGRGYLRRNRRMNKVGK